MSKLITLLTFLISLSTFAEISEKQIMEQLMGIHGTNWNSFIKSSDATKDKIKNTLSAIISRNINPKDFGYDEYHTEDLRNNAISEFGNFISIDSSGKIAESDLKFLNDLKDNASNNPESHESLSVYTTLKNAGTPESLDLLSDALGATDDLATSYTIARNIHEHITGNGDRKIDPTLDLAYIDPYTPNIKKPFFERKGKWDTSIKKAMKSVADSYQVVKDKSKDDSFKKEFLNLGRGVTEQAKKYAISLKDQPHQDAFANREIASSDDFEDRTQSTDYLQEQEESREIASSEQGNKAYIYILLLLLAGSVVFFIRKIFN